MVVSRPSELLDIHSGMGYVEFADFQLFMMHGSTKNVIYIALF